MTKAPVTPNTYCYDNDAKHRHQLAVKRFYRKVAKALPEYTIKTHFNPGGIAVWGEVYAEVYLSGKPVVEFYNVGFMADKPILVRQWDGRNSGANGYVSDLESLSMQVKTLAERPFVRF